MISSAIPSVNIVFGKQGDYLRMVTAHTTESCYAIRLLNPFRGVLQVVQSGGARALSSDGVDWEIQVRSRRPDDLWGSASPKPVVQYLRFGHWSTARGLDHLPAHPLLNFTAMQREAENLAESLATHVTDLPFPQLDRYELWLLDSDERVPLALLASSTTRPDPGRRRLPTQWCCADRRESDFAASAADRLRPPHPGDSNPHPHMSALERMIRIASGHSLARWIERHPDGSGLPLVNRGTKQAAERLPQSAFPELLIREHWPAAVDAALVSAYLDWASPMLLTLQGISDETRNRLEQKASRHAMRLERHWRLYPRINDQSRVNAARVEARLRRSHASVTR